MNKNLGQKRGITLIALVITIIVLLILAGVTIATLMGDNGVLTKSSEAKIKDNHAKVFEALGLESQTHRIEEETNSSTKDLITYLQGKGFIHNNLVVNVQTLLGEKLSTGNGDINGNKDIYKLEEIAEVGKLATTGSEQIKIASNTNQNKMYNVVYYDNNEKVTNLGIIGNGTSQAITDQNKEKIINVIDDGIVETLSGEVRKVSLELESGVFKEIKELSDENSYLITTNGIKQATINAFIDKQGKVYTWGSNSSGQIGDGRTEIGYENYVSIPICISDIEGNPLKDKKISNIVSDEYTMVALDEDGKVYTWGDNGYGILGNGTTQGINIPICISEMENDLKGKKITDVFLDNHMIIALDEQGEIYTWGNNVSGRLGDGITEVGYKEYRSTPMCISNLENDLKGKKITDVFLNYGIVVVLDDEGKIYTWGDNEYGQLGDEGTEVRYDEYRDIPMCISDMENDLKGKKIASISYYSDVVIVLDEEGKVYTWGRNNDGQLGDGETEVGYNTYRNVPRCISDISGSDLKGKKITEIVYSYDNIVIAIDNEGKVYTWGRNESGQLGDGMTEIGYDNYRNIPKCISDINESDLKGKKITSIPYSSDIVIALDEEGKIYTWGSNERGQLGDGIIEIGYGNYRNIPMCINDIEGKRVVDIIYIELDGKVVVLDNQGKIYTWGDGELIKCVSDSSDENNVLYNKEINIILSIDRDLKEFYYYADNEGNLYYQFIQRNPV